MFPQIEIDHPNVYKATALHYAVKNNQFFLACLLVDKGKKRKLASLFYVIVIVTFRRFSSNI